MSICFLNSKKDKKYASDIINACGIINEIESRTASNGVLELEEVSMINLIKIINETPATNIAFLINKDLILSKWYLAITLSVFLKAYAKSPKYKKLHNM